MLQAMKGRLHKASVTAYETFEHTMSRTELTRNSAEGLASTYIVLVKVIMGILAL